MSELIQKVKTFLTSRKRSYQFTFQENNVYAQAVLADLAKFCRANKTTFHKDDRASAVLQGRHEVWLRIQNYLNLSPDELWELYRRSNIDE